MKGKTVSLVLGSGGARGLAHIGVIRLLTERGFEIRYVSGASMGALIGGIYAAGQLETYESWVQALDKAAVVKLLDFSFNRAALFKGDRVVRTLEEMIGDCQIEDLPIGYTAVATALAEQREIWIRHGSLFRAIRASIAIPGVFTPVNDGGRMLVDGGLINPVPIAPTLNNDTDLTVVVNLNGRVARVADREAAVSRDPQDDGGAEERRNAIQAFLAGLLGGNGGGEVDDLSLVELMTQSMDLMATMISRLKLAAYTPDIAIDIPRNVCSFYEFYRASEVIDVGYEIARRVLDRQLGE